MVFYHSNKNLTKTGVYLNGFSLRQSLLPLIWIDLARLSGQHAPGVPSAFLPLGFQVHASSLGFVHGEVSSGPHDSVASTLPTKPSLQPLVHLLVPTWTYNGMEKSNSQVKGQFQQLATP